MSIDRYINDRFGALIDRLVELDCDLGSEFADIVRAGVSVTLLQKIVDTSPPGDNSHATVYLWRNDANADITIDNLRRSPTRPNPLFEAIFDTVAPAIAERFGVEIPGDRTPAFLLDCTCYEGPEQYDVYEAVTLRKVGYLKLRGQFFYATAGDPEDPHLYSGVPCGVSRFVDGERDRWLTEALRAIWKESHGDDVSLANLYRIESSVYIETFPEFIPPTDSRRERRTFRSQTV